MSNLDYASFLNETRAVLTKRRGWFGKVHDDDLFTASPSAGDALHDHIETQRLLLKKGTVVWAAVVQANEKLYELNNHWYPAELICSTDPHFDSHPFELENLANAVFTLKGTEPDAPELQRLAAEITDEMTRSFGDPLPTPWLNDFTNGRNIRRYSVILDRYHLPERILTERLVPVLTHAGCNNVMVLPASNWGPKMLELWKLEDSVKQGLQADYDERERERKSRPMIDATSAALESLKSFAGDGAPSICVRVSYEGGHVLYVVQPDEIEPDDHIMTIKDVTFVMDPSSADKIWGCKLDWEEHGEVAGFSFE